MNSRTLVTLLLCEIVHPTLDQELLGDISVANTTDTYSHMLPGMSGEAADAMGETLG